jgi:hypothetical protein
MRRFSLGCALAFCWANGLSAQTAYPQAFLDAAREANTARLIAELCPNIGFSDAAEAAALDRVRRELVSGGQTAAEVQVFVDNPPVAWLQQRLTEYAVDKGFATDAAASACAAGRAEIDARSGIAAYLSTQ